MVLPPGVIAIPDELPPKVGTILLNTTAVVIVKKMSEWIASQKNPRNQYRVGELANFEGDDVIVLDGSATSDESFTAVFWAPDVEFEGPSGPVKPSLIYDPRLVVGGLPVKGVITTLDTQRYTLEIGDSIVPMNTVKVFTTSPLTETAGRKQAARQCAERGCIPLDPAIQRLMRSEVGLITKIENPTGAGNPPDPRAQQTRKRGG